MKLEGKDQMLISNYGFWERRNVIALVLACARRGRHIIDVVTVTARVVFDSGLPQVHLFMCSLCSRVLIFLLQRST